MHTVYKLVMQRDDQLLSLTTGDLGPAGTVRYAQGIMVVPRFLGSKIFAFSTREAAQKYQYMSGSGPLPGTQLWEAKTSTPPLVPVGLWIPYPDSSSLETYWARIGAVGLIDMPVPTGTVLVDDLTLAKKLS